jgi:hypothetical protein
LHERAAGAERRWAEYQEILESGSLVARMEARHAALADPNPGVRSNTIWLFLRRFDVLPLEIVLSPGAAFGPADVPRTELSAVRWGDETRSFYARTRFHGHGGRVEGRIVGEQIHVRFFNLVMPSELGSIDGARASRKGVVGRDCRVTLVPNIANSALEGTMNCDRTSIALPVRLSLG